MTISVNDQSMATATNIDLRAQLKIFWKQVYQDGFHKRNQKYSMGIPKIILEVQTLNKKILQAAFHGENLVLNTA